MSKHTLIGLFSFLSIPLIGFAHVTSSPSHMATHTNTVSTPSTKSIIQPVKNRVLSGELKLKRAQNQQRTQSGSTWSGKITPGIWSFNGIIKKPVVKSTFETAAERQRQRQADLDNQHKEQREQEDRQRAIKAAHDALKQAEERARQAELEKRQESETIEAYCDRANRQWFLERRLRVKSVNDCITRLKSFEKVGRKIVANQMKEAMERKRFGDRLKKLCIEEYTKTGKVPEYCANVVLPSSWSGNTQSGGTLTRR